MGNYFPAFKGQLKIHVSYLPYPHKVIKKQETKNTQFSISFTIWELKTVFVFLSILSYQTIFLLWEIKNNSLKQKIGKKKNVTKHSSPISFFEIKN